MPKNHWENTDIAYQCRFFVNEVEFSKHLWLDCLALVQKKLKYLGRLQIKPEKMRGLGVPQLLDFANYLGLSD